MLDDRAVRGRRDSGAASRCRGVPRRRPWHTLPLCPRPTIQDRRSRMTFTPSSRSGRTATRRTSGGTCSEDWLMASMTHRAAPPVGVTPGGRAGDARLRHVHRRPRTDRQARRAVRGLDGRHEQVRSPGTWKGCRSSRPQRPQPRLPVRAFADLIGSGPTSVASPRFSTERRPGRPGRPDCAATVMRKRGNDLVPIMHAKLALLGHLQ